MRNGNTTYFCGDTERLNHQLAAIAQSNSGHPAAKVVLHAGKNTIDAPIEQPLTGFGEKAPDRLPIDWSVRRSCPSSDVLRGRCQCNRRSVTVDIWIANDIELDSLSIPPKSSSNPLVKSMRSSIDTTSISDMEASNQALHRRHTIEVS